MLDIGCGSGVPTMELARLTDGEIIGLDINQDLLAKLNSNVKKAGLSNRITTIKCSIFDMDFQDESFDIIWSEGSIYVVGFKRGLQEWQRFLKPNGFMVIHDEEGDVKQKLEYIPRCGYHLLEYFKLPSETWWIEYYAPLEKLVNRVRIKYADDPKALIALEEDQREIDMFKKNPGLYSSIFFVMGRK